MDFLATVMEVLDVERPASQKDWAFDGVSVMPILRGETPAVREFGHMYMTATASVKDGYSYRYGNWKLAVGGVSCDPGQASFNCSKPQLYNMASDIAEDMNLAEKEPEILAAIMANFTRWQKSVLNSMANESMCSNTPGPTPSAPFPAHPQPSTQCKITQNSGLGGNDVAHGVVQTYEECCGACKMIDVCKGADFRPASKMRPAFDGSTTGGTYVSGLTIALQARTSSLAHYNALSQVSHQGSVPAEWTSPRCCGVSASVAVMICEITCRSTYANSFNKALQSENFEVC